jgi:hypothetical protein
VLFYGFAIILVILAENLKFRKQASRSHCSKEAHGKATGKRLSERSYGEGAVGEEALGKKPSERSPRKEAIEKKLSVFSRGVDRRLQCRRRARLPAVRPGEPQPNSWFGALAPEGFQGRI